MDLCYMDTPLDTLGIAHLRPRKFWKIKGVFLAYASHHLLQKVSYVWLGQFDSLNMCGS